MFVRYDEWCRVCLSVCKASDSEHEIVTTNKEDFMRRNEQGGEDISSTEILERGENIELDIAALHSAVKDEIKNIEL